MSVNYPASLPCPYCGGHGGWHQWSGEGQCPGSLSEQSSTIATGSTWFVLENTNLKSLCALAADALAPYALGFPDGAQIRSLIAELRKAVE